MSQSLQPQGPHEAESQESSMDLEITESVVASGNGTAELTLEVTDAGAFGFRAEAEQQEALGRRATFTYDGQGFELSDDEESLAFFGTPGSLHMADIALTAARYCPSKTGRRRWN